MTNIYQHPKYYELAFSYRDIAYEVDVMVRAMQDYSKIPVENILEIACGNSPHMQDFLQRGYNYSGLDLSPEMLAYSKEKANSLGYQISLFQENLADFSLPKQMDFAYTMLGSLYVQNTTELLSHFTSMEKTLKSGGLYFLDWCVDFSPLSNTKDSWTMKQDSIVAKVHYATRIKNATAQHYEENLKLTIRDGKERLRFNHTNLRRAIYPQEFLLVATKLHSFEFVGWWNDWDFRQPLELTRTQIVRPITILRKI